MFFPIFKKITMKMKTMTRLMYQLDQNAFRNGVTMEYRNRMFGKSFLRKGQKKNDRKTNTNHCFIQFYKILKCIVN